MREIKFRAWIPEKKAMMMAGSLDFWFETIKDLRINPLRNKPGTIMLQYTGLKDKNGKEIYEGDIVRIGDDLLEEVKWIDVGHWMGDKQPMVGFVSHGTIYKDKPVKVIGNIYENQELLEGSK